MIVRLLALIALFLIPSLLHASNLTIGVVAPQSGQYAVLGQQILTGARMQIEAAGNRMLAIDENCEDGSGEKIASQAISGDASALVGFLCAQSLWSAMPALKDADIPAITLSVRSPILFEDAVKKEWPLFSLAPGPLAEEEAIEQAILANWSGKPFAILDDGTIRFREIAAHLRQRLEEKGLPPQLIDTFRPAVENQIRLVRRLKKAGVTQVFISGDRKDIAVFARDVVAEKAGITVMGGEALMAADDGLALPDGVLAVIPQPWRDQPEASAIVSALNEQGVIVEGYVLPAHAAAQLATKAVERAKADGKKASDVLTSETFLTAVGPAQFDAQHIRDNNPYGVFVSREDGFQPLPAKEPTN